MVDVWRKARKKPVIVEFREVNPEVDLFDSEDKVWRKGEIIRTLEGELRAFTDKHFIIRGVNGELYPIEKEIFFKTYEILEDSKR